MAKNMENWGIISFFLRCSYMNIHKNVRAVHINDYLNVHINIHMNAHIIKNVHLNVHSNVHKEILNKGTVALLSRFQSISQLICLL